MVLNCDLMKIARDHAANMVRTGSFAHVIEGKNSAHRVQKAGYEYSRLAENLAKAKSSPGDVVKLWMKSPDHRKKYFKSPS